jgi:hypothetical protein
VRAATGEDGVETPRTPIIGGVGMSHSAKLAEINSNLERFLALLPSMMAEHAGQYVLMRHKSVVGYYDSAIDAQIAGNQKYEDRLFSIQHVREVAEELGHFAYAVHSGDA